MSDSTRRAREIKVAVRLTSERYRARRASIDAVESALEDETMREILADVMRMGPRDRQLLLSIARQIASPGGDG